ncbi:MAG: hypothetical protein H6Q89_1863 [Myxococcaceae bacterium]|nr:hypothetical protein [Myxococcaceae bacterium]
MAESSGGVFEMLWDCAFCGTTALLGKTNRYCPSCGAPQDETKRYFPPPGKEVAANTSFDGVDVKCPACATPNGAKANNCRHCGSPLNEAAAVKQVAERSNKPIAPVAPPKKAGMGLGMKIGLGAGVLLLGVIAVGVLWKKEVTATVEGHRWKREIAIESLQQVNESAWRDAVPSDAYAMSCSKEQRSTKKIPDGETCHTKDVDRGDGTFERKNVCETKYRSEPVYDDKCRFTVDRWRRARGVVAEGGLDDTPAWPPVALRQAGTCRGCEREGARTQEYVVALGGPKDAKFKCDKPESEWRQYKQGGKYPLQVRVLTGGADCSSLKP